jgi:nicotinate phosphoribosyltransferase
VSSGPRSPNPALLTDLYELTMLQAYMEEGLEQDAVFDLFVRRLPPHRNYLLACGLDSVLQLLETLQFDNAALEYLESVGRFSTRFLDYLSNLRFTGDVLAVREGTPVFPLEPLVEVIAPLPQAQLIETIVMNQVGVQTVLASKAARIVTAARGRSVVDFAFRRMHGIDAALKGARAFYIAGVESTSNVAAGQAYGIPVSGTMAHSYIQAHDDELEAFRNFTAMYPDTTLLVDTYDALAGLRLVVALARELGDEFRVKAVRLDSGDLAMQAHEARRILDEAGLTSVRIVVSGGLEETSIARLLDAGAPIDGFGVGTEMGVSADIPSLDLVYKLVSYAGVDRVKLSTNKQVLPGRKQIFRVEENGVAVRDVLALADEQHEGRALLTPVMRGGERLAAGRETIEESRDRARSETARLPPRVRELASAEPYRVNVSPALQRQFDALAAIHAGRSDRPDNDDRAGSLAGAALIIVDAQNDFCPGGALPVPDGDRVIPVLNRLAERFAAEGRPVYASRDWHPHDSTHFKKFGGPWPVHCVAGSPGAGFHPDLRLPAGSTVISKGQGRDDAGYSALEAKTDEGSPVADDLRRRGVTALYVGGLATDYCVRVTAVDARRAGFRVAVIADAIAGIASDTSEQALADMREAGAVLMPAAALP